MLSAEYPSDFGLSKYPRNPNKRQFQNRWSSMIASLWKGRISNECGVSDFDSFITILCSMNMFDVKDSLFPEGRLIGKLGQRLLSTVNDQLLDSQSTPIKFWPRLFPFFIFLRGTLPRMLITVCFACIYNTIWWFRGTFGHCHSPNAINI